MPRVLNGLEPLATTTIDGLMSATDKVKLDSINEIQIDKTIDIPAAIMSFTDGADNIPMALTVGIEPVQDLHGYDHPWPGGGGKNLLNFNAFKTIAIYNGVAEFGENSVKLTATVNDCYTRFGEAYFPEDVRIPVTEGEVVTISWEADSNNDGRVFLFHGNTASQSVSANNASAKSISIVASSTDTFITFRLGVQNSGESITYKNVMIRKNGDATFEPYSNICPISGWTECNVTVAPTSNPDDPDKEVYTITFPSEAGTVYGGTLTVNKDGTGSLVVDRANVMMSDQTIVRRNTQTSGLYRFAFAPTLAVVQGANKYVVKSNALVEGDSMASYQNGHRIEYSIGNDLNNNYINFFATDLQTVEDWQTFATNNNVQVCYNLATPLTYSLTPGQVKTLFGVNNISADTGNINSLAYSKQTSGLINAQDKFKLNSLATVSLTGNYNDLLNKPDLSVYLTTVPTMVGATSSAAGTAGLVPAPTTGDVDKFLAGDGTYKSGGLPMVILSYGSSTWQDFIDAYNNNVIVYCRASSNSNPASGSQTRMAFMAYVNDASTPTNVEFQYYRSISSHSATQMGDQVFVYKLDKNSGWSVTTREASIKKIVPATDSKIGVSWSNNEVTLSNTMTAADMPMSSTNSTTAKVSMENMIQTVVASTSSIAINNVNPGALIVCLRNSQYYIGILGGSSADTLLASGSPPCSYSSYSSGTLTMTNNTGNNIRITVYSPV